MLSLFFQVCSDLSYKVLFIIDYANKTKMEEIGVVNIKKITVGIFK